MSALVDVMSQVRAVTVYRQGAMITRAAELVRQGDGFPERVQLSGLPLSLDDSSLRVELEAVQADSQAALPIAGDLRVALAVPGNDPQLAPPTNAELEQARLDLALIGGELEQLERARARLARLQPTARGKPEEGKPPAASPTAARLELLSFRRQRSEQLTEQIHTLRERERLAKQQLASLQERERIASAQRNARSYELRKAAVLDLSAAEQSGPGLVERVRIKLHYFVPGARWAPSYTVRLDRSMRAASLELRAMVGQATGEDWRGVALTLSTAIPQQWTELPKLDSQRIGRRQLTPAKTGWRPPPVGADQLYADFDRGLGQPLAGDEPKPELEEEEEEPEDEQFNFDESLPELGRSPAPPEPEPFEFTASAAPPMPIAASSMPPPASAPAVRGVVQYDPMPKRAKRGGLMGSLASTFASDDDDGGSAPPTGYQALERELALLAGRDLLDYGRLRLFAPDHARRGSLRRIETRVLYQQLSDDTFALDLAIEQIDDAVASARQLESQQAPEGCRWPQTEGGFDYAYVADAPCDLLSDGQFHSLAIDVREAEAKPRYIAVPRETQDVFRTVALRNPLAAPLLPGPADVYVAGKFALTTPIELTPIGARIELGLGVEQAIKIARNISFAEETTGMFKRQLALRHTIEIEIANHLSSAATVEVRERLPTVTDGEDDIELSVERVDPSWEDHESADRSLRGGRRWVVEVPANQKRELAATWVATIPINHELLGGNRREV